MNSVEWNPKYNVLAYAGDDKNKYQADEGMIFWTHAKCYWKHKNHLRLQLTCVHFVSGVFRIFGFENA